MIKLQFSTRTRWSGDSASHYPIAETDDSGGETERLEREGQAKDAEVDRLKEALEIGEHERTVAAGEKDKLEAKLKELEEQ